MKIAFSETQLSQPHRAFRKAPPFFKSLLCAMSSWERACRQASVTVPQCQRNSAMWALSISRRRPDWTPGYFGKVLGSASARVDQQAGVTRTEISAFGANYPGQR